MSLELNIQDVVGDLARGNLFEVEIPYLGENFKFVCNASSLPPSTLQNVPVGYMNRKIGYAGDREYGDWTLNVYNDESQSVRRLLLEWSDLIQAHGRQIVGAQASEYKQTAFVRQFNRAGEKTAEFKMTGAYPITVGEIALSWDDNNTVEKFEVTMHIDWFEPLY